MAANPIPVPNQVLIPSVTKEQTLAFSKVWNNKGIAILLDSSAVQFATDWANIALRSFVQDQMIKFEAMRAKQMEEMGKQTIFPPDTPVPAKSTIIMEA